jgi:hypothetical protein
LTSGGFFFEENRASTENLPKTIEKVATKQSTRGRGKEQIR